METKQINQFLTDLYQGPTKHEQKSTDSLTPEKMELLKAVMQKLVNYGLLSDPGKIRDWCNALTDKSEKELVEGVRKAKDHVGPLSLGEFRGMCVYVSPLSERIVPRLERKPSDRATVEKYRIERISKLGF